MALHAATPTVTYFELLLVIRSVGVLVDVVCSDVHRAVQLLIEALGCLYVYGSFEIAITADS